MLKRVQGRTASGRVKTKSRAYGLIPSLQKHSSKMQTMQFFFFHCKMLELLYTGDRIDILFLWPTSSTRSHFILSQCYFVLPVAVARAWLGAGDQMWTRPPVPAFRQPTGPHGRLPVKVLTPSEAALAHRPLSLVFQVLASCLCLLVCLQEI